eukprot:jgi/Astpho2/7636/Aster-x0778
MSVLGRMCTWLAVLSIVGAANHRSLDIVIAKHHKPTSVLLPWLKELTMLEAVMDMYTTVVIFNKDEEFRPNIEYDMRQELDLAVPLHVQQLPNVGRETETFLRYIVHRYTSLPTHVLFVQDEAHNVDHLLSSVQETFRPDTEYLTLNSWKGRVTTDGDAYHTFEHHIVPYLWAVSTQTLFPHDGYLAAYNSQFLVSKNRILHRPLSAYKFLLNVLHQPDADPVLQLPSAHLAGYVIERLWNALFDCWDVEDLHCVTGHLSSSSMPQPWIVNPDPAAADATEAPNDH